MVSGISSGAIVLSNRRGTALTDARIFGALANELQATELNNNDLIVHASAMPAAIIGAERASKLGYGSGHLAMTEMVKALALAVEARHHVARAHAQLRKNADAIGHDWTMYGDAFDTPPVEGALPRVATQGVTAA